MLVLAGPRLPSIRSSSSSPVFSWWRRCSARRSPGRTGFCCPPWFGSPRTGWVLVLLLLFWVRRCWCCWRNWLSGGGVWRWDEDDDDEGGRGGGPISAPEPAPQPSIPVSMPNLGPLSAGSALVSPQAVFVLPGSRLGSASGRTLFMVLRTVRLQQNQQKSQFESWDTVLGTSWQLRSHGQVSLRWGETRTWRSHKTQTDAQRSEWVTV